MTSGSKAQQKFSKAASAESTSESAVFVPNPLAKKSGRSAKPAAVADDDVKPASREPSQPSFSLSGPGSGTAAPKAAALSKPQTSAVKLPKTGKGKPQ